MTFDDREFDFILKELKSYLTNPFFKFKKIVIVFENASIACNIDISEHEFLYKFILVLVEVVYAWCKGVKFIVVQKLTGTFKDNPCLKAFVGVGKTIIICTKGNRKP